MTLNDRELTALQEGRGVHVNVSLESLLAAANVLGVSYEQMRVRGLVTVTDATTEEGSR